MNRRRQVLSVVVALAAVAGARLLPGPSRVTQAVDCSGVTPAANTALKSIAVVTGLTGRPLFIASPPGDRDRLFIVEQNGFIRVKKRGDAPATFSTFLDISARVQATPSLDEMGLLGMAFDPGYATNGIFYVNYTEGPLNGPWFTVVARYVVSVSDPDVADPNSEERLLRFQQPQSNHNGGELQFGPDGYLYISTGDGGGAGDVHGTCGNGQSTTTLLGKLLRVDVRGVAPTSLPPDCGGATAAYRVPADNPLAGGIGGNCDEIWTFGLRNPWRSSFDAANGDLYIGDVGQNCWEELDYAPGGDHGGENYGWRMMEGNHCYNNSTPSRCDPTPVTCSGVPPCMDPSFTDPVAEYDHGAGCAITGGYVYRGCLMPGFTGTYFYGDYCSAFIRSLKMSGGVAINPGDWTTQLDPGHALTNSLTSFGVDDQGEIYIANRQGSVLRIMPPFTDLEVSGRGTASPFLLSQSGWSWEDLAFASMHPVGFYRVYRGVPGGTFQCVFTTPVPRWAGGDPATPATGTLFAYVVTAVSPDGEESLDGVPPVTLAPGSCP